MARPSFTDLPTEILESIFLHLDPHSLLSVSQANKFIEKLTANAPIIWRHLCQIRFNTWDERHDIAAKFAGPLSDVDWRSLFVSKIEIEQRTGELLNRILSTRHKRITRMTEIAEYGYDAKERLLREITCPDDTKDVLARRFYANEVLERIHREIAIKVWKNLGDGENVSIERALGAYDVFSRVGGNVDLDLISNYIDSLATAMLGEYPDFQDMSPRMKASALASYLRDQGFKGVSDTSYRALRNSFIGLVLQSDTHESLPLISVAIYCAVARRLGIDARPCCFLFHVYTLVYAPKNYNLDGEYKPTTSEDREYMYLDPFRSSSEVQQDDLRRVLRDMGIPTPKHTRFLSDTSTPEMVLRTARNIMNSIQSIHQTDAAVSDIQASWLDAHLDIDNAFYATTWATLFLGSGDDGDFPTLSINATRLEQCLHHLLDHLRNHFPADVTLLSRYVIPMFRSPLQSAMLGNIVRNVYEEDALLPNATHRSERTTKVNFRVGQLFQHKRYNYEGVITGWDVACGAGEEWIRSMGIDGLPKGRNQAFYHVLVSDKLFRYVAEENIEPITSGAGPSKALLRLAGRHFKRWDAATWRFVSNIHEDYPDD